MREAAGSLRSLRELNRERVVQTLRDVGVASRADISRATGLSRTTVSSLVADLKDEGLIVERAGGRSPHEAFFTPDGKELWAVVRGEDYVSVIDPVKMKEIRRVQTANGPGMVLFRPDGRYAFVPSSFTPELDVVDMQSYKVIARVPQASPFSPNLAVSRDGNEVWFTLKDSGKTQVMSAQPPFSILATLDTGPITNHVTLVENANGKFAYVTVGGENAVKVYRRGERPELISTISTGDLPTASGDRAMERVFTSDSRIRMRLLRSTHSVTKFSRQFR